MKRLHKVQKFGMMIASLDRSAAFQIVLFIITAFVLFFTEHQLTQESDLELKKIIHGIFIFIVSIIVFLSFRFIRTSMENLYFLHHFIFILNKKSITFYEAHDIASYVRENINRQEQYCNQLKRLIKYQEKRCKKLQRKKKNASLLQTEKEDLKSIRTILGLI